jgi:hypothetical protein
LLCCVGTGRLAPFRGGSKAADSRATRNPARSPASGDSNRGLRVIGWQRCLSQSIQRDSRHEDGGGLARELPSSASIRRFVMRALLSRESTLQSIPSTEPLRCLAARAPVESTSFDACHADPPRVVTAGRAFTTNDPPTSGVPLSLAGTPNRHHPVRARRTRRLSTLRPTYAGDLATTDSTRERLAPNPRSFGSAAFRRRLRRKPARQARTCAIAVKR